MGSIRVVLARIVFGLLRLGTWGHLWPPLSVAAVIECDDLILLIDRSDGLGLCLPGGLVKWNETTRQALRREVLEETGFHIAVVGCLGLYDEPDRDPRFRCIEIAYRATILDGYPRPSAEGPLVWLPRSPLPAGLAFDHRLVLSEYLTRHASCFAMEG